MECRPLTDSDIAAAPPWLDQADLRPDCWRDQTTRAISSWQGAELVAVGRIFTSRAHTTRYWTEVIVAPQLRRRGYGRQMVAHLAGLRPESKPLCTLGYDSSETVLFARHLGARPYQTCPPQQVPTRYASHLIPGAAVTLPGSALKPDELRQAWTDIDAWVHDSWSPVAPGFEEPLLAGFTDDLDLTHTRVVATPTIRAAAFVFRDDRQPVVVAECRTSNEPAGSSSYAPASTTA